MRALIVCFVTAASIVAVAGEATAQTASRQQCHRGSLGWYCRDVLETPDSTITTDCAFGRRNNECVTETQRKGPPPAPTVERSDIGVLIMRGGPR